VEIDQWSKLFASPWERAGGRVSSRQLHPTTGERRCCDKRRIAEVQLAAWQPCAHRATGLLPQLCLQHDELRDMCALSPWLLPGEATEVRLTMTLRGSRTGKRVQELRTARASARLRVGGKFKLVATGQATLRGKKKRIARVAWSSGKLPANNENTSLKATVASAAEAGTSRPISTTTTGWRSGHATLTSAEHGALCTSNQEELTWGRAWRLQSGNPVDPQRQDGGRARGVPQYPHH
jgi:hypothetical protein